MDPQNARQKYVAVESMEQSWAWKLFAAEMARKLDEAKKHSVDVKGKTQDERTAAAGAVNVLEQIAEYLPQTKRALMAAAAKKKKPSSPN